MLDTSTEASWSLKGFLNWAKDVDLKVIYDIGSHIGEFTKIAQQAFPNATYHLFEPNVVHNDWVKDLGRVHNLYLSNEVKQAEFYSSNISSDSFYKEFTGIHENVEPLKVTTTALDGYVKEQGLEYPDLIKIDTQGAEIEILEGAKECAKRAQFIILECPVVEYNRNGMLFNDYIAYMFSIGYVPRYLTEVHFLNGVICQLDVAFQNTNRG